MHDKASINDPIHVALAVYDPSGTYSQHAGVTITSIFENTQSKVIIHILHDDTLTEDNRKKFIRTAEKYNQTIELHDVTEYAYMINDELVKVSENWTVGTLYRLFIPDVLPSVEKIIYVDCDIVFDLDIKELWDIDTEDYCMAGVHDYCTAVGSDRSVRDFLIGCNSHTYVNAGVLVMNLNLIRLRGNLFLNAMKWLKRHIHLVMFSDQDIINALFYKSIKLIDKRFNNIHSVTEQETKNTIIHTAGWDRAWEITGMPYQILYWKLYLRSEWGKNKSPDELIETISSFAPKRTPGVYLPLYKRIALKFYNRKPFRIIVYIIQDVLHRLRCVFQ